MYHLQITQYGDVLEYVIVLLALGTYQYRMYHVCNREKVVRQTVVCESPLQLSLKHIYVTGWSSVV